MLTEDLITEVQRVYKDLPVGLCFFDADLRYVQINDWLAELNGLPAEEHLGRTIGELIPEVAAGVEAELRKVIDAGEPVIGGTIVAETPAEPGVKRRFEHSYYAIKSDDGEVIGISCIVEDVTVRSEALEALHRNRDELEKKIDKRTATLQQINEDLSQEIAQKRQVQVALRHSESKLASILDISSDAIISIDENQRITLFNQGARLIFGYETREVIGKPLDILLPEQYRRVHKKHVQKYAQSSQQSRLMGERTEVQGLKKDGTLFPASASISRFESQGEVKLNVYLRDISAFKRIQGAVQKHRDELAHMNRIGGLGEVSASLAHELNQPLTAILTNAQVLSMQSEIGSPLTEEGKEIISDLISSARRAGKVISQMKTLLKPGTLLKEALEVNQIVVEIGHLLHSELIFRQVNLTMELAPDLPAVFGNYSQLQQVMLNFVMNALEAMESVDAGDRFLLIRTRLAAPTIVELCVQDSGVGFKKKSLKQLLMPFYTTKESGMGMGLPISHTIVKNHGGKMSAKNNQGAGASFFVTLPIVCAEAAAESSIKPEHDSRKELLDETTIFIVDDDPAVLKALRRLIRTTGYMVRTFSSADEFLQCEHYFGYGCLVVDLHMPDKTGIDLQAELNKRKYTMPIIFITGAGDAQSGVTAMKQGALDFLEKPVDGEKLMELVARAIEIDYQARGYYTQHLLAKEKLTRLTPREAEIMKLVVKGHLNKQIAYSLGISEKTVKVHRGRVMKKLETRSLAEMIRVSRIAAHAP